MKKKNLKSLKLNKKSISNLEKDSSKGGFILSIDICAIPIETIALCASYSCGDYLCW